MHGSNRSATGARPAVKPSCARRITCAAAVAGERRAAQRHD